MKFQELNIWQCLVCRSLSYLPPEKINTASLYSKNYFHEGEYKDYQGHIAVHEANARRKLNILRSLYPKPLKIFEIGCAYGYFLKVAISEGVSSVYGVDVSHDAITTAREKIGPFFGGEDETPPFSYNCLVGWDVWEHLERPTEVFRKHLESLEPGGIVALTTVDSGSFVARIRGKKWRQLHPPTHVHFPTGEALRKNLKALGCEVIYQKSFSPGRALETYADALGLRWPDFEKKIRYLSFPLNLRDTQLVIARKPT